MIYSINKGSSKTITRVGLNNRGYPLDLTGAVITITAKQFSNSSTNLFTKVSTDTSQVEIVDASRGLFLVKFLSANTSSLNYKSIYCAQSIVIGSNTFTDTFFMRITGVTAGAYAINSYSQIPHGTTAERTAYGLTLTSTDRVSYFDDDDQTPYFWNGSVWK